MLIRCFVGGAHNEALALSEPAALMAMVRDELRHILGIQAKPVLKRVYQWKDSMPQYTIGHSHRIARIEEILSFHGGLFIAGNAYRGIGMNDCITNAYQLADKIGRALS